MTTHPSGSPIIQAGKLVGAVTHVILLARLPIFRSRNAPCFAEQNARGAICAHSLTSKLADSFRLIMCSKSHRGVWNIYRKYAECEPSCSQ
ncbi:MAG: hypothetical protein J6V09_03890 [Clostridia bacterium]|nr:hypothetical protein [Clostridia bacterium]